MTRQEKVEQIHKIAIELFKKDGYDKTTVSNICSKAGITKPTFYSYNLQKDDLLANYYYIDVTDDWVRSGDEDVWGSIITGFKLWADKSFSIGPDLLSTFLSSQIQKKGISMPLYRGWAAKISELIDEGKKKGIVCSTAPTEDLLQTLLVLNLGYSYYYCTEQNQESGIDEFIEGIGTVLQVPAEVMEKHYEA